MLQIRADHDVISETVRFFIRSKSFGQDGKRVYSQPLTMTHVEEGERIPIAFELDTGEVQVLLNELWRFGFRPSNGEGSVGELAATKYHLEDMRKLVFVTRT